MSEELINKLRKAGVKASLVSRIQDETVIEIEDIADTIEATKTLIEYCIADTQATMEFHDLMMRGSGIGFELSKEDMMERYGIEAPKMGRMYKGFKPGQLSLIKPATPRTTPPKSWIWMDYMAKRALSKGETGRYEELAQHLRELAEKYKEDSKRLESIINRHGYIESPNGARRYLSSRDMGHNDPLR